jgi:hypothetical protein
MNIIRMATGREVMKLDSKRPGERGGADVSGERDAWFVGVPELS